MRTRPTQPRNDAVTMHAIASARARVDDALALKDFIKFAGLVMTTGNADEALVRAEQVQAPERIRGMIQKAATSAATTGNAGLSGDSPWVRAFLDSLRSIGAFDRLAADAMQLPLHPSKVIINSSVIVASSTGEGVAKPVKALSLTPADIVPQKTIAQVVLSRSLIDALGDEGLAALGRELRASVALGTDTAAMTVLTATNSMEANSPGASFDQMLGDLEELAHNVEISAASVPYFITTPAIAKALARAATANGINSMGLLGGRLMGTDVLVSDGQGGGQITLADASALAVAQEPINLKSSEHAAIEMDTQPTGDSTTPTHVQMVSMFQTNSRCLLAERNFAVKVLRQNAVATLSGVMWGTPDGSPSSF